MQYTKKQLIERVAERQGLTKATAERIVDEVFVQLELATELHDGNEVAIHNFGKFSTKTRAARTGRNPATGESIEIAAATSVKFAPPKRSRICSTRNNRFPECLCLSRKRALIGRHSGNFLCA